MRGIALKLLEQRLVFPSIANHQFALLVEQKSINTIVTANVNAIKAITLIPKRFVSHALILFAQHVLLLAQQLLAVFVPLMLTL